MSVVASKNARIEDLGAVAFGDGRPQKRARHGPVAVDRALEQAAEMVMVLAGMSQMRAGQPPGAAELDLAARAFQILTQYVASLPPEELLGNGTIEALIEELGLRKTEKKDEDKREDDVAGVAEEMQKCISSMAETTAAAMLAINKQGGTLDGACGFSTEEKDMDAGFSQTELSEPVNSAGLSVPEDGDDSDDAADSDLFSGSPPSLPAMHSTSVDLPAPMYAQTFNDAIAQQESRGIGSIHGMAPVPPHKDYSGNTLKPPYAGMLPPNTPRPIGRPRKDGITGYSVLKPMILPVDQDAASKMLGLAVQQFITLRNSAMRVTPVTLSSAYMCTPVRCESCQEMVKDAPSSLVCDSCEQLYHVKCLPTLNLGRIPKGEWECPKCVKTNKGQPQTPKYGPVRKPSAKLTPSSFPTRTSSEAPKPVHGFGNAYVMSHMGQTPGLGSVAKPFSSLQADNKDPYQRSVGAKFSDTKDPDSEEAGPEHMDQKSADSIHKESRPAGGAAQTLKIRIRTKKLGDNMKEEATSQAQASDSSVRDPYERSILSPAQPSTGVSSLQEKTLLTSLSPVPGLSKDFSSDSSSLKASSTPIQSPSGGGSADVVTKNFSTQGILQHGFEESVRKDMSRHGGAFSENTEIAGVKLEALEAYKSSEECITSADLEAAGLSQLAEQLHPGERPEEVIRMDWIGDILHEDDVQVYYGACRVGDHVFSVNDYALFRPESSDVAPYIARLQTLWEDKLQHSKWVKVNWCYYPADIPVVVGRPSEPEPDEVYESNHCDNNLMGSIQGPCQVLTPLKFREERERRSELLRQDPLKLKGLNPIFVCRWLYDAPRGTFGLAPEDLPVK